MNNYSAKWMILCCMSLCFSLGCFAQNYVFAQLTGTPINTTGWNLEGAAQVDNLASTNTSELMVCPLNGSSGAVFYNHPINLSLCSQWRAEFDFRLYDGSGADGLAFCFLDVPPSGFVSGGGLGIPSTANGLKVCFDTWNNCRGNDNSDVHYQMPKIEIRWGAGYNECTPQPTRDNTDGRISYIRSTQYNHATITYDNGNISVYVNDTLYLTGFQQFNYAGYLGFTASTGGYNDNQSIKNAIIYTQMPLSNAGIGASVCPGNTVQLGAAATAGYLYAWSPANGLSDTSAANPTLQPDNHTDSIQQYTYYVHTAFTTAPGCTSEDSVNIIVYPRPLVNFETPEICLNDAVARFTDSSYTASPSTLPFTYLWQFGDANAGIANPNTSVLQNPSHIYSAAAHYNVKLAVVNSKGCADSLTKVFTVNGAIPKAGFSINTNKVLCNNLPITITDTSSVNFGDITKIQIDWGDAAGIVQTDNTPYNGKEYTHQYPFTNSTAVGNYIIHYTAYSGITCLNETSSNIVIEPSPNADFAAIPPICQNNPAIKISEATETVGLKGNFVFSGTGISSNGTFNPQSLKAGTYELISKFIAADGCTDTAMQNITVWPLPVITLPPVEYIYEDKPTLLNAEATGNSLQYLWTPSIYLDDNKILNPECTPMNDTAYTLTVTDVNGCSTSDSMWVLVLRTPAIPNAFTPNGDGLNDHWIIKYLDRYPNCTVDIYNRWGQHIFHSVGYSVPWDGTYNSQPVPLGAYTYIIDTKKSGKPLVGTVIVIR